MALSDDIRERTRLIRDTEGTVRGYLQEALARIRVVLANLPSDAQVWSLTAIDAEIRRVLEAQGAQAGLAVGVQHAALATAGVVMVDEALGRSGARLAVPRIDPQQLYAMRNFTTAKISGVTLAAVDRIDSELGLTMIGTQTPFQAAQKIAGILSEATTDRAVTIVRTELARAYSTASFARLAQAAKVVPGLKKKWRKSGKLHPRAHHATINGQVQEWDKPFLLKGGSVKMMHPHDPTAPAAEVINCGCIALPVVPKP